MGPLPTETAVFSKDRPFPAIITESRLLTKPGSGKETRHFVINLTGSGLRYEAGDSLAIFPTNRAAEVDEILERLGAKEDESVSPAALRLAEPIPLRAALTERLSLAKPLPKFLGWLATKVTAPAEQAKLAGLLAPESKEVFSSYLEQREYVDVLAEFPSARITPQELVDQMRRLVPRLYSIASSPRLYPTEAHLTIAVVRYETNGRDRFGVCSTFVADRVRVGATAVPVFVTHSPFKPPADGDRDAIMVGPGTGIAPFRAFVQDRAASGATGRNWVFFGEQHRATDFLYEQEWTEWLASGRLARLDTAFSRDQVHKIYVQDRLRENAAEVWAWLRGGAHFYVCGDAKRMAKDVDTALHDIVAEQGAMGTSAAADYVNQMKKDKRYQRDVY
ncbi:MAG TPA: sulfite reductase subunit alpha [Opitutus sp.]|nr:sulfite reductase subunit alpha [Opitutus sp.]